MSTERSRLCSACLYLSFACWLVYTAVRFVYVLALCKQMWSYKVYFVETNFSDKILPVLIRSWRKNLKRETSQTKIGELLKHVHFYFLFLIYYRLCYRYGNILFYFTCFCVKPFNRKKKKKEILQTVLIRNCPRGR